jgi:aspartyl-tRNA(Asn)/glutamyl-tRNA(Gln) amidotransferase subunit A
MTINELQLHNLTIMQASKLIGTRKISPVELTKAFLHRIDVLDGLVHAWVTVIHESAVQQAKKAEDDIMRGGYLGPLHGIPYGAKDIFYTMNVRTAAGSQVNPDFVPSENAAVINKLNSAGAILLGKTTTPEYAFRVSDLKTRNPWNLDHTPGGSSSGSAAALAASMSCFTLGTQTFGSLVRPAAYNGLIGLKPTYGRVSRYGVIPASWSLDHVGALTRTVEDAAIVLEAISGYDSRDPASLPYDAPSYTDFIDNDIRGKVIGIPSSFFFAEDPQITSAIENAIEVFKDLGIKFQSIDLPSCLKEAIDSHQIVIRSEAAAYHQENFREASEKFGSHIREQLELGYLIPAVDYLRAQRIRTVFRNEFMKLFDKIDALVTPSSPTVAPFGYEMGDPVFIGPFTNAGLPAMNIPVGFEPTKGLPIGMQLVAPLQDEELLISLGHQYQKRTNWHNVRPMLDI